MEAGTRARPTRRTAPSEGAAPPGHLRCSSAISGVSVRAQRPGHRSRDAGRSGAAHTRHPARRGRPQRPRREARAPSGTGQQVCGGDRGAQTGNAREPRGPRARQLDPADVGSGCTAVSASVTNSPGYGFHVCWFFLRIWPLGREALPRGGGDQLRPRQGAGYLALGGPRAEPQS
ncbi:hypothetical protein NDU88_004540 [Pleurodeles waltl]|uniref:Uncharacterized protein n=1 Tax=Pleurodeles waltl TaxID=8319 RepID=A0AAV7MA76_PLEWA|nr:hypothetical protein NDU88_004540 [Pleurodeles waltl]